MWHGLMENFITEMRLDPSGRYSATSAIRRRDVLDGSFAYHDLIFTVLYCRGDIISQYSGTNRNEQIILVNVPGRSEPLVLFFFLLFRLIATYSKK